jgi:mono/diheme cytochrome c family protein/uncharacterized membrane protein
MRDVSGLFRQICMKCHGADGTGSQTRSLLSEIPDFTSAPWQERRADARLMASILDGKGSEMPPQRGNVSEEQARGLVAHVRGFAPTREKPGQGEQAGRAMASFAERYRRLQEEQEELRRQFRELSQVSPGGARSKPSESGQHRVAQESAPAALGTPPVGELFRQRCVKCHGADGTGSRTRSLLSEIPDFTIASWQAQRADAQLMASILDGKGSDMPPQRGKIGEEQVHSLVAYVRAFAPTKGNPGRVKQEGPAPSEPTVAEPPRGLFEKQHLPVRTTSHVQADSSRFPQRPAPRQSAPPLAPGTPAFRELFRKRCVKCHGADGTGNEARDRLPEIPNFTNVSWQARRTDARLLESILDGKGEDMPPVRGKISEQQARGLVAFVRTFAPTPGKPEQAEQERPGLDELPEAVPPRSFFEKLARWLGKIHPPAVHFPIALLTAAAVAELLRMATGEPAFDAISRYCIWFGTLTAVMAGALGWCAGSLRLTDASWVLMTHRWLGTSTVACAGLVLLLSEASRSPDRRRIRMSFRVALLVVAVLVSATGYFGGAVVFGLNHYTWPK